MRKVYLSVIGFSLLCRLNGYAQTKDSISNKAPFSLYTPENKPEPKQTDYFPRRLRIDEINLVSSYYTQTGNHSAVTGGIGTEAVTDNSNGLDINLLWLNGALNKNTLAVG